MDVVRVYFDDLGVFFTSGSIVIALHRDLNMSHRSAVTFSGTLS
jgi:hypothetical protein